MAAVIRFVLGIAVAVGGIARMAEFAMWHPPSLERDFKLVIVALITIVGGCVVIRSFQQLFGK